MSVATGREVEVGDGSELRLEIGGDDESGGGGGNDADDCGGGEIGADESVKVEVEAALKVEDSPGSRVPSGRRIGA